MSHTDSQTAMIIGASRTIGLQLATEFLERGWNVVATVRSGMSDGLRALAEQHPTTLRIEQLDITDRERIGLLCERLGDVSVDLLFVSAGTTNANIPVEDVPTADFVDVMVTNALSPMLVVEGLQSLVPATGTIGVMSSRQGSIGMNERGGHEVYRASKSALNQLMRSYAARHASDRRTFLLLHPGWVQTELGGPGAQLTVQESARGVADVLVSHAHDGGLQFLDYQGNTVAW